MTKQEEEKWIIEAREYRDTFFNDSRARKMLKKKRDSEQRGKKLEIKNQIFLDEYGDWLDQIQTSFTRLKRFPTLLSFHHLLLEKRGISRTTQFIYHIENYLAAIYIFDQRINKFYQFIEKFSQKYKCSSVDLKNINQLRRNLTNCVSPIMNIRGSHTHVKNFQDADIDEIIKYDKSGDFTNNISEKKLFKNKAHSLLKLQRQKWEKDMSEDMRKCEINTGILFKAVDKMVWKIYRKIK